MFPYTNDTAIRSTALRSHPLYENLYTFWSKIFVMEVVPYVTIIVLNAFIVAKIVKSSRFRRNFHQSVAAQEVTATANSSAYYLVCPPSGSNNDLCPCDGRRGSRGSRGSRSRCNTLSTTASISSVTLAKRRASLSCPGGGSGRREARPGMGMQNGLASPQQQALLSTPTSPNPAPGVIKGHSAIEVHESDPCPEAANRTSLERDMEEALKVDEEYTRKKKGSGKRRFPLPAATRRKFFCRQRTLDLTASSCSAPGSKSSPSAVTAVTSLSGNTHHTSVSPRQTTPSAAGGCAHALSRGNTLPAANGHSTPPAHPPPNMPKKHEVSLAITLVGISVLFIVCQSFKLVGDVYELFCEKDRDPETGEETCASTQFIEATISLANLSTCINSAANFLVYMLRGKKFRDFFLETYCCKRPTYGHSSKRRLSSRQQAILNSVAQERSILFKMRNQHGDAEATVTWY